MNKYIYIFIAFMVIVFASYIATRADFDLDSTNYQAEKETASGGAVLVKNNETKMNAKTEILKDTSSDYYLGNKYAPVLMIEYASLSCPHCAKFHSNVLEPLLKSHINTGKLKYVYRDFPLNAPALAGGVLAQCAGEKRYFSFLKVLFKSQENWAFTQDYLDVLKNIAKIGGIDEAKFEECMADKSIEDKILAQKKDALEVLEVQSTPTIFINGVLYKGNRSYEDVAAYIDRMYSGK